MIKFIETNTRSKPKPFDGKALAATTSPIALNSQCNKIIGREICNEKVLTLVHFECAHTNTHRTNVYEWSKTTSTSHSQSAASSFSAGHLTCHFERYAHTSSSRTSNISCRTHELRGEERNVEIWNMKIGVSDLKMSDLVVTTESTLHVAIRENTLAHERTPSELSAFDFHSFLYFFLCTAKWVAVDQSSAHHYYYHFHAEQLYIQMEKSTKKKKKLERSPGIWMKKWTKTHDSRACDEFLLFTSVSLQRNSSALTSFIRETNSNQVRVHCACRRGLEGLEWDG